MTARHHPFQDLLGDKLWPLVDTRPDKQIWKYYAPGWRDNADYRSDYAKFAELNRNRRSFIRPSSSWAELSPTSGWDTAYPLPPPIWVVVFQFVPGFHIEVPFFRGPKPYSIEPSTDAEVASIVSECIAIGGYNELSLKEWRAAVAAKR